jgi:2-iminobutanoate/2-iminopropanoate deaminase
VRASIQAEGYRVGQATDWACRRLDPSPIAVTEESSPMPKSVPNLPGLERGTLPFSKIVEANGFVFVAGQIGDAPDGSGPVPGGIEAETRAMLENVGRLLKIVGLDYPDVVKCTVYIVDFDEGGAMNAVYREFFPTDPPTRATVEVTRLALGARIEIEVMAAR